MPIWNVDPGDLNPNQHPNPSPNLNLEDDAIDGDNMKMIIKEHKDPKIYIKYRKL